MQSFGAISTSLGGERSHLRTSHLPGRHTRRHSALPHPKTVVWCRRRRAGAHIARDQRTRLDITLGSPVGPDPGAFRPVTTRKGRCPPNPNPWCPFSGPRAAEGGFESAGPPVQTQTGACAPAPLLCRPHRGKPTSRPHWRDVGCTRAGNGRKCRIGLPGTAPLCHMCGFIGTPTGREPQQREGAFPLWTAQRQLQRGEPAPDGANARPNGASQSERSLERSLTSSRPINFGAR